MSRKILFKTVEVEACNRKRERGVYCKCNQDKWRFIVKEQNDGGKWMENYSEKIARGGKCFLNCPNQSLAKHGPRIYL